MADVTAFPNLMRAARRAERGKRYRHDVLVFNALREDWLHALARQLEDGSWMPSAHRHFHIHDPKPRWISAAPYRDRVVHHAICNVIGPHMEKRLIDDCWANRKGRGSHRAVLRYQQFAGRYGFALKVDIRKYFPSIDHQILKEQLVRRFKNTALVALLGQIVDAGIVPEVHDAWFPGDDLLTPLSRPKGLPIGNLTSQLWANSYLDDFDHWVKEKLGARGYLRFVDDFVLLSDDAAQLADWRDALTERLATVRLKPHPRKTVIQPTRAGVTFLGYVVWPDRIRVRGATLRRFRRNVRAAGPSRQRLAAWRGHTRLAGSYRRRRLPFD